jgi:PTH1 family peptidyl-tRNA hydrolase
MKYLIVGLGNPGQDYDGTRHNIGFDVLDRMALENKVVWSSEKHGWVCNFSYKGRSLFLLKPNTYMNLSGKAVAYWLQKEKIHPNKTLVVVDDLALPVAKLRLRPGGSDGGHNGLKSINETLGTNQYPRLRFGIGNDFPKGRQSEFVLGKWNNIETELVENALAKAIEAIQHFVTMELSLAMNKVNIG